MRERLEAFYDGELSIDERVAIQQHLGDCAACSAAAGELVDIGATLRDLAAVVTEEHRVEEFRMSADVIERLNVEEPFSIRAQVAEWFQDMHLVWAGLGASVATAICVIGSASVLHAANQERPNSMARVIAVLASPGSNDNPMRLNYEMMAPRAVTDAAIEMSGRGRRVHAVGGGLARRPRAGRRDDQRSRADRPGVNAMLNEAYRMKFAPAHRARRRRRGQHGVAGGEHHGEGPPRRRHDGVAAGAATAHDARADRAAADSRGGGHRWSQAGGHAADEAGRSGSRGRWPLLPRAAFRL